MKIVCDCGSTIELNEFDKETGRKNHKTEDEGRYVTYDINLLDTWETHDQIGLMCRSCGKAVWWFC
jgi:hypothetical protein